MHTILQAGVLALGLALAPVSVAAEPDPLAKASPLEAIRLATTLGVGDIKAVDDPESWWADTKVRSWSVFRVFGPGWDDTTPDFVVVYVVDGNPLLQWQVDTRAGTIALAKSGDVGCTFSTPQWCPPKGTEVKAEAAQ
jgi:hypothetical protein